MNVPTLHLRASQSAHQHPIDSPYHDFYQCISGGSLKQALKLLQKKCNIRSSTDFMRHLFKKISKDTIEEQLSQEFDVLPDLIKKLLEEGADPNITFLSLSIGDDEYSDLTCWQVAYLYWKYLEDVGDPKEETMRTVFHLMLEVFGLNLRAKFSEQSLSDGGHFAEDTELEGEYLERITLAQYALAMGDWETCDMLISKDPTLVHETCYMTTAKGLLDEYHLLSCFNPSCHDRYCNGLSCRGLAVDELRRSVETGDIVSVIANDFRTPGTVARYGEVSFYHLAARRRDFEICFYIRGYGVDPRKRDSGSRSMLEYAKIGPCSISIEPKQLEKITRLMKVTVSPARSRPFPATEYYLTKAGFDLVNNPATKCSVVRFCLTKSSYSRVTTRNNVRFQADPSIPQCNRALPVHYVGSGYDIGHQKNADSATSFEESMRDSFHLTNGLPQVPNLNRGYWKNRIEKMIYNLVQRNQCVEVFVGPVFTNKEEGIGGSHVVSYPVIGEKGVSVPTHIFAVIYLHNLGKPIRYLAYLVPNQPIKTSSYPKLDPNNPPGAFRTSLQRIQELSGVGFLEWRPGVKEW